jgi:multidrug resistance efflux pump
VAQIRAQLENAKWLLGETTVRSPCECYVVNLQLRPGAFVAGIPLNAVMTLVEAEGQVVAMFNQNELQLVESGNEVEFTLQTLPGRIVKGKVDSIVWAQGLGQLPASGTVPMTGFMAMPPGRYAVKFDVAERDRELFLAAGAAGQAAIYTDNGHAVHILRKVILRVGSYLNYLVLKLH